MSIAPSPRVEELFDAASGLAVAERLTFLNEACGKDLGLRDTVLSLLDAMDQAEPYFSTLGRRLGLGEADDPVQLGKQTIGPYRLTRLLGRGSMGVVYLAERADAQFEKRVALKILPVGVRSESSRLRLLAERQILARLVHPNIARLLDGGITEDQTPYFVMDYVEGVPIDEYGDTHGLDLTRRIDLFTQAAQAVDYAHRNLVVHRDIKPSNVLVDAAGEVKLVDFGVAKFLAEDASDVTLTAALGLPMTLAYASPEAVRGDPVTTAADVYSLGVLLYELLTGQLPYPIDPADPAEARRVIGEVEATLPSKARALAEHAARLGTDPARLTQSLRGDLDNVLGKTLHKDPGLRYQTPEQLIADLQRHREHLPVLARAPTVGYRLGKFVKRRKGAVAATFAATALLVTIAILASSYAIVTQRQSQAIAQERDTAEEVRRFWVETFRTSDLDAAEELSAIELLDRGAQRVQGDESSSQQRKATLLTNIGEAYEGLASYDKAIELYEQALELLGANGGKSTPPYADTLARLAYVHSQTVNVAAAERYANEALALRKKFGDQAGVAELAVTQGIMNIGKGDYETAEAYLNDALRINQSLFGDRHASVGRVLSNLGVIRYLQGNYAAAEPLLRDSLDILRASHSDDTDRVSLAIINLAFILMRTERYDEARELFLESLGSTTPDKPGELVRRAHALNGLGLIDLAEDDLDGAETRIREARRLAQLHLGPDTPKTALFSHNLARVLLQKGTAPEARALIVEAINAYEEHTPEHTQLADLRYDLGRCHALEDNYAEAERLMLDAYQHFLARRGSDHPSTQKAIAGLRDLYQGWGKPAEARAFAAQLANARCSAGAGSGDCL